MIRIWLEKVQVAQSWQDIHRRVTDVKKVFERMDKLTRNVWRSQQMIHATTNAGYYLTPDQLVKIEKVLKYGEAVPFGRRLRELGIDHEIYIRHWLKESRVPAHELG